MPVSNYAALRRPSRKPAFQGLEAANDNWRIPSPANDNRAAIAAGLEFAVRRIPRYIIVEGIKQIVGTVHAYMVGAQAAPDMIAGGWRIIGECPANLGRGPTNDGHAYSGVPAWSCSIQGHDGIDPPHGLEVPNSSSSYYVAGTKLVYPPHVPWGFLVQKVYQRDLPVAPGDETIVPGDPVPGRPPRYVTPVSPVIPYPGLDPLILPIGVPTTWPQPVPYHLIPGWRQNPWRSPREQPQRGYDVPGRIQLPRPRPNPGFEVNTGVAPVPVAAHKYQPPGPGKKERKFTLRQSMGEGLYLTIGAITETLDVLDAFYDALPRHLRGRGKLTPQQKAALVYRHFQHLDIAKVLENIATDQVEDFVIGRLARGAGKHSGKWLGKRGPGILVGPAL